MLPVSFCEWTKSLSGQGHSGQWNEWMNSKASATKFSSFPHFLLYLWYTELYGCLFVSLMGFSHLMDLPGSGFHLHSHKKYHSVNERSADLCICTKHKTFSKRGDWQKDTVVILKGSGGKSWEWAPNKELFSILDKTELCSEVRGTLGFRRPLIMFCQRRKWWGLIHKMGRELARKTLP